MAGKVQELGGKVLMPRTEVPGTGSFYLVADPEGNASGLWQSAKPPAPAKKAPSKKAAGGKKKRK